MKQKYKKIAYEKEPPRVAAVDGKYESIERDLDLLLSRLGVHEEIHSMSGKKVFIKPNMLGVYEPERHVTTWPFMVRHLVRLFREAGAEVTVGDNCGVGGYGLNQRVAKVSGIAAASDGAFKNVARDTVQVPFKSRFLESHVVSRDMMEADYLVSLPKLKTHSLTLFTGGVKNMFGIVAGAGKGRSHASAPGNKDFGEMLADIFSLRPPDLTIMDAITAMEGNGPSGGRLKQVGKLIGSKNAVAVDAVACRMMGLPPLEVHHLRVAGRRGFGPLEIEDLELVGDAPEGHFKLPVTFHRLSCVGRFVNQRIFTPIARVRLSLDKKKCKQCGLCVEGCPTGAMKMGKDFPEIDDKVCIRCYCCQELCPESAWSVRGIGRFFF